MPSETGDKFCHAMSIQNTMFDRYKMFLTTVDRSCFLLDQDITLVFREDVVSIILFNFL